MQQRAWTLVVFLVACGEDTSRNPDGNQNGNQNGNPNGNANALPTAPVGEWRWYEGGTCRNGTSAGFGYRYGTSNNLMIYFQGGNACFNQSTCSATPQQVGATEYNSGILDVTRANNPVADWHHVFVPYCTGDVHTGTRAGAQHASIPGTQDFVGYANVGAFLTRLVPTFGEVDQVLVTGSSAGGFSAIYNVSRIQDAFGTVPVTLIDDAGPPMDDLYLAPCLQQRWRDVWGLTQSLPAACPECTGVDGGGIINYVAWLSTEYPTSTFALVTALQDSTIRGFWGFGSNNCQNLDSAWPLAYAGTTFEAGLVDLRDTWMGANWGTYYVTGTQHTFLGGSSFYSASVNNTALTAWVADILAGAPRHVAP